MATRCRLAASGPIVVNPVLYSKVPYDPVRDLQPDDEDQADARAVQGQRAGALPQVPTLQELGFKGFDVTQFVGLMAPAKTDPAIVRRLHQEVVKALEAPEVIERLQVEGGNDLVGSSPQAFAATIERELAMYRKLVTDARIKQE